MKSLQQFAQALGGEVRGRQVHAPGPGHSTHDRSMSIMLSATAPEGFVVHSFCGDDPITCRDYIKEKLGIVSTFTPAQKMNGHTDPAAVMRRVKRKAATPARKPPGTVTATYEYRNAAGEVVYEVQRLEWSDFPKEFRQRVPLPGGGYRWKLKGVKPVLYRLPELLQYPDASPIFITEGEKDCDNLRNRGYVATTISGSAEWTPELAEPLRGKDIIVLQDNDETGVEKAKAAAVALHPIAASVRVVLLPDLPPKGDVTNYFEDGHTQEQFDDEWRKASLYVPSIRDEDQTDDADADDADADDDVDLIVATPYVWTDPATIPLRDWLYGHILLREYVTATVAPGGVGKTTLIVVEVLAMVSGKMLLGIMPDEVLRVWIWNLEDPLEETKRKVQAAALHFGLTEDDIGDRLFVDSGRDQPLVIATTTKAGAMIVQPVVDALVAEIIARKIDVIVIDPFISCHEVPENDNMMQDMIVKEWGRVASRAKCAVHLVDHTRKMMNGEAEVTTESTRGAKSKTDAARVVRVVNRMTENEADRAGVENRRLYFRTYNDKSNHAPPVETSDWFKLKGIDLGNGADFGPGDNVAVATRWDWPDPLEGMSAADFDKVAAKIRTGKWRAHPQAKEWAGFAVAAALDINITTKAGKTKVSGMLATWLAAGSLIEVDGEDEKRMPRKFIEVRED
jgi:hypothetical protein